MSEKPEALRLAQEFELHVAFGSGMTIRRTEIEAVAAELRNLHAENERLRGLLTEARGAKWLVVQDNLLDRIDAALRREETK